MKKLRSQLKQIKDQNKAGTKNSAREKSKIDNASLIDDWHLWERVSATLTPLKKNSPQIRDFGQKDKMSASKKNISAARTYWAPAYKAENKQEKHNIERIEPNLRKRIVRGNIAIDKTLDLHGLRQDEAFRALTNFISANYSCGLRNLLVITGKGGRGQGRGEDCNIGQGQRGVFRRQGVLKSMLPVWLASQPIAFMVSGWEVSAKKHGGEGAFYVRLKRQTKKEEK